MRGCACRGTAANLARTCRVWRKRAAKLFGGKAYESALARLRKNPGHTRARTCTRDDALALESKPCAHVEREEGVT